MIRKIPKSSASQGTWVGTTRSSGRCPHGDPTLSLLSETQHFFATNCFTSLVFLPSFLHHLSSQSVALHALKTVLKSTPLFTLLTLSAPFNLSVFLSSRAPLPCLQIRWSCHCSTSFLYQLHPVYKSSLIALWFVIHAPISSLFFYTNKFLLWKPLISSPILQTFSLAEWRHSHPSMIF